MADIFISYAKTDRDRAQQLAGALEAFGWSVWWDRELVGGTAYDNVIERELDSARCVIVGWSSAALDSEWVRDEAEDARARNVILPVLFEHVKAPLRFRRIHTIDVSEWDGTQPSEVSNQLVRAITQMLGPSPTQEKRKAQEEGKRRRAEEQETKRRAEAERNAQEEATRQTEQKARRKSEEVDTRRRRAVTEARRKAELESKQREKERQRPEAEGEQQSEEVQRQEPPGARRDVEPREALRKRKGAPEDAKPPRVAKRTPPQIRATRPPPSERAPRRTLLTISVTLAVLVLGASVFWGIYDPDTSTDQVANSTEVKIQQRLADAERHYQTGRLDSPKGENALEHYRAVLELDPDNQVARAGLDRVLVRFIALADSALVAQEIDQAESFLAKAEGIAPANAELAGARARLDKSRRATQEGEKIERLLASAERDLQQGRLDGPKGSNALEGYRAVLALDPDNQAARGGLGRVLSRYLALADGALDEQKLNKAEEYLAKIDGIAPANAEAINIRARIEKARATTKEGEKIRRLLANAEKDLQQSRLTSPKGNNAVERYRAVLDLDPGNQAAQAGLRRVVSRYIALANGAVVGQKLDKAEEYLTKAEGIAPADSKLANIRTRIEKARRTTQEHENIERLLASAERDLQQGRLDSPKGNNAVEGYRAVLALDPDNRAAEAGLGRVVSRYLEFAKRSLADQDLDQAAIYLAKAGRIEADNPELAHVRAELEKARMAPSRLTFAVFPFQSLAICHYSVRDEVTDAADAVIRNQPHAKLEYSFYREGADPKIIPGIHELWSDNAARREPREDIVRKAGRKLGVNGVLMAWYICSRSQYVSEDNYEVEVYLIDVNRNQVFHAKENFLDVDRAIFKVFDQFFAVYSISSG